MINRYNTIAKVAPRPLVTAMGTMTLDAVFDTPCAVAGTWYPMLGTFSDGALTDFTLDASGILTFTGEDPCLCSFIGTSDLEADKVCKVYYALSLKGVIQSGVQTPAKFENANSTENISINRPALLSKDDTLQVFMKSDTTNTTVQVNTLNLLFKGNTRYK